MELEGLARAEADSVLRGPKRVALLVYLAATGSRGFIRRDSLLPLLWPELDQERARHALRNTLLTLRKALGTDSIRNRGKEEIALAKGLLWYDAAAFEETLSTGRWQQALDLYAGDFLSGFHVPEVAPAFEHWMDRERDRLAHGYCSALERVAERRTERGEHDEAAGLWRLLVDREPLSERFVIRLMESLAQGGHRSAALREAEAHIERLRREYDAEAPAPVVDLALKLRGVSDALGTAESRGTAGAATDIPLVGRDDEWRRLLAAWDAAAGGSAGFVVISGVAGIGKTRLAQEHLVWAAHSGCACCQAHCDAIGGRLAYGPITEWIRAEPVRSRLGGLAPVWLSEVARVLPELLAELPELPRPEPITQGWQRRQLFESLAKGVLRAPQPLLLFIDDLQWCDVETLEWLRFLMRYAPHARLLVVATVRDDEPVPMQPWKRLALALRESGQLTEILLDSLDRAETAALAARVADRQLSSSQTDHVFKETEGNPLFVVESVRAGLLSADVPRSVPVPEGTALTPRVQAVIEFRLSQLSASARDVVEFAAVLGRRFDLRTLREASSLGEGALSRSADELWQRRILREQGPEIYDFSHDKLREVAYAQIGPARRAMLHRHVARALEAIHASGLDLVSRQLANHHELAGAVELALDYYERAAQVAGRTYGDEEVIDLLTRAVRLLGAVPEGQSRDEREIRLQIVLGTSAARARGWAAAEAGNAFTRAAELSLGLDEPPEELITAAWGLHAFHAVRGDTAKAVEASDPLWSLIRRGNHPQVQAVSEFNRAMAHFHQGMLAEADRRLDRVLLDSEHGQHSVPIASFPVGTLSLVYRAHVAWHLGDEERALDNARAASSLAEEHANPFEQAIALAYTAVLHQFRWDIESLRASADATWTLCDKYGVSYYRAWGSILRGWARGIEGEPERGIQQIERGLAELLETGAGLRRPYYMGLLAELHGRAGDAQRGLTILSKARQVAEANRELWCVPELMRLEGELYRNRGDEDQADRCFQAAISLGAEQGAVAVPARAASNRHTPGQSHGG